MDPALQQRYKTRFGEPDESEEISSETKAGSFTSPPLVASEAASLLQRSASETVQAIASPEAAASSEAHLLVRSPTTPRTPLQAAVVDVLCRLTCVNEEARKQIASQFLLIGGSSQFEGFSEELERLVSEVLQFPVDLNLLPCGYTFAGASFTYCWHRSNCVGKQFESD